MLIILAIFLSSAFAKSHEKYINPLPQEEKQDVSNKVKLTTKKTFENTKIVSENNKKNILQITEKQLKEYDKFVQDLLKEESFNMKRRRLDDRISYKNESVKLQRTSNDNSVKIDEFSDVNNKSVSVHVIKRRSNDDTVQESDTDHAKVGVVKENTMPKRIANLNKESINETIVTYIGRNPLGKGKSEYDLDKKAEPNTLKKYEEHSSLHSYQVYEIAWPNLTDEKLFVKSAKPILDQPNFVPVYKYSTNYEHPHNRRRLDPGVKNSKGTHFLLDDKNKGKKEQVNEYISHLNEELRKFGVNKKEQLGSRKGDGKDEYNEYNTIANILSVTDEKDVFVNLERLQHLDLKLRRRNDDMDLGILMKVLKDMIEENSVALKQYDWLATTVKIQLALEKLFQIIDRTINRRRIHPADIQILNYAILIHNFSLELKAPNKKKLRKYVTLLPRNKSKKNKIVKEKGLINRVWLLRELIPGLTVNDGLHALREFLLDVEDSLYDLHEAITTVAKITRFKHQNWFENIKELYLTSDEKHIQELLLHISFSRLIDLIETGCQHGLKKNFIQYMRRYKEEAKQTVEEMLFVLKILDDIKIILQ